MWSRLGPVRMVPGDPLWDLGLLSKWNALPSPLFPLVWIHNIGTKGAQLRSQPGNFTTSFLDTSDRRSFPDPLCPTIFDCRNLGKKKSTFWPLPHLFKAEWFHVKWFSRNLDTPLPPIHVLPVDQMLSQFDVFGWMKPRCSMPHSGSPNYRLKKAIPWQPINKGKIRKGQPCSRPLFRGETLQNQ